MKPHSSTSLLTWVALAVECVGASRKSGVVVAKYGDKNVYFDLEDLGNTIGQWDLYGFDAPSPHNPF
ncbi:hypothetical protein JHK86_006108 [Glycine max]|nr:hypothetical protein JHK86_006108 [Glycine max]